MKNIILTLFLTLILVHAFGQSEKVSYKIVADRFEADYNNGNYDSIFAMCSPEMQVVFPIDKTKDFFTTLKSQAGPITKRQFVKYIKRTVALYKVNCAEAELAIIISIDDSSKINELYVKPYEEDSLPIIERNTTKLRLPFSGEWTVHWGGDTKELNRHFDNQAQKKAFDIFITDEKGRSFKTDAGTNEDYYAFGKEITSPCDGEVVLAVDGIKDNMPGEMNPVYLPGNSVIIKTSNNEYLVFAHFKQHSVKVSEGQRVKPGMLLGLCGNSGNSSEPHLHFHIQNAENMNVATGIKCYFDKLIVNGQAKTDYSPVKNDKIRNQ